jgi:hypothetical protein
MGAAFTLARIGKPNEFRRGTLRVLNCYPTDRNHETNPENPPNHFRTHTKRYVDTRMPVRI